MINLKKTLEQITNVKIEFDFANKVILNTESNDIIKNKYQKDELDKIISKAYEKLKSNNEDIENHPFNSKEVQNNFGKSLSEDYDNKLDVISNRLSQYQIVMLVTHLEYILKEIHREILRLNPTILKSDRKIELNRLITQPKDDIINDEIER